MTPVAPESQPTGVRALVATAGGTGLRAAATAAAAYFPGDPREDQGRRDDRRDDGDYRPGHVESNVAKYQPGFPPSGVHDIMTHSPLP